MSNENSEKTSYKMIIIGDSAVGKTCIFKKITSGIFSEKSIQTYINIYNKNSEGNVMEVDVKLWDTAGQERFRSITTSYYKSSEGLLLMYDITKKDSFDSIENWIQSIKESLGEDEKYLIVLLGNKLDLANDNPELRMVSTEDGY